MVLYHVYYYKCLCSLCILWILFFHHRFLFYNYIYHVFFWPSRRHSAYFVALFVIVWSHDICCGFYPPRFLLVLALPLSLIYGLLYYLNSQRLLWSWYYCLVCLLHLVLLVCLSSTRSVVLSVVVWISQRLYWSLYCSLACLVHLFWFFVCMPLCSLPCGTLSRHLC